MNLNDWFKATTEGNIKAVEAKNKATEAVADLAKDKIENDIEKKNNFNNEDDLNFIKRAFVKNAINEKKPDSTRLKGIEKLYGENYQRSIPILGDSAAAAIAFFLGEQGRFNGEQAENIISNYLEKGKSKEVGQEIAKINNENFNIIQEPLSRENYRKLISNTMKEASLPVDWIEDISMRLNNDPNLSEQEAQKIIESSIDKFDKNPDYLNNLGATRPESGTYGHSKDTADIFGKLLENSGLNLSKEDINKRVTAARLHDYGKSTVPYRDLNSKAAPREMKKDDPNLELAKEKVINRIKPHSANGAEALAALDIDELATYYSKVHHNKVETLEDNLLKLADSFNAITGKRSYRDPVTPQKALEELKGGVGFQYTQEAYDILKKVVEDGEIPSPKNEALPLDKVYNNQAAKALKDEGITKSTLSKADKFAKGVYDVNSALSAIMGLKGFQYFGKKIFQNSKTNAKAYALLKITDDRLERDKIKYIYNDEEIDQLFADNIDEITEKLLK